MAIHPYFVAQARIAMSAVDGDPDKSADLAAWAEAAKTREDVGGVVVDQSGRLIAETSPRGGVIRALTPDGESLVGWELGIALARAEREIGRCVHIKRSQLCSGAGEHVRRAEAAIPPAGALYAKQVAERLNLKVDTVHGYRSRGQMPAPDGHDVHGHPWWLPGTLAWWRAEFIDDMTTTD